MKQNKKDRLSLLIISLLKKKINFMGSFLSYSLHYRKKQRNIILTAPALLYQLYCWIMPACTSRILMVFLIQMNRIEYSCALEKYSSKPIPVFLICKKQKRRSEKQRLKQ